MTVNIDPALLPSALPDAQRLPGILSRYRDPSLVRSLTEIAITFTPLVLLWAAMWGLTHVSYWLTLALALPTAGFLVRLFAIQHDCSHGAFFRTRAINDWVGRVFGVLTLTPYDYWKRTHAAHHATAGNLDRRGLGDIKTLTVDEYLAMGWRGRFGYRLYRNPIVMFGLGPAYLFLLQHRAPLGLMWGAGWKPWISTMSTNAGIAVVVALLMWLIGPGVFLMIHGPIFVLAASMGVWLFYVQHQFDGANWAMRRAGPCRTPPCTARHITICRSCCAGSAPISACTMSIIWRAAFRSTACWKFCATIPNFAKSAV